MRHKQTVTAISFLLLALGVAACGAKSGNSSSSGGSQKTITFGAPVSLTGADASEGKLTQNGYRLCEQVVNAKGGVMVGGKAEKIAIKYQDDASTPATSAQIVDQFNDKGIKLILSPYGSAATEAAAPVIERNGQLMADSLGTDDAIFEQGYKRTFGVMSVASKYAGSLVDAVHDLAKPAPKVVAFLSADDGFSKAVAVSGAKDAKALGWSTLPTQYYPNGTSDVSTAITAIKHRHPDVVFESGHNEEGIALIKQAQELGLKPRGFAETVAPPTPEFAQTLGKQANGVLGSSQWVPTSAPDSDKYFGTAMAYAQAYQKAFGQAPDYHGASASAACLAMVLSIEKANSTDADKVRDAMAALSTDSFYGHISFDSTGKNANKPMVVIQIQNEKAVPVWPRSIATAKLIWPGTANE
jgi:branched-chain amino acid transport system substrate-binding protein